MRNQGPGWPTQSKPARSANVSSQKSERELLWPRAAEGGDRDGPGPLGWSRAGGLAERNSRTIISAWWSSAAHLGRRIDDSMRAPHRADPLEDLVLAVGLAVAEPVLEQWGDGEGSRTIVWAANRVPASAAALRIAGSSCWSNRVSTARSITPAGKRGPGQRGRSPRAARLAASSVAPACRLSSGSSARDRQEIPAALCSASSPSRSNRGPPGRLGDDRDSPVGTPPRTARQRRASPIRRSNG